MIPLDLYSIVNVDIHLHSNLDPHDGMAGTRRVVFSPQQAMDRAKQYGLHALAFTHHGKKILTPQMEDYAGKRDLTLIPGMEAYIGPRRVHVVVLNPFNIELHDWEDLYQEKRQNRAGYMLAVHPFYPLDDCLRHEFHEHRALFDGVENCYLRFAGFHRYNKMAQNIADKYNLPFIATSDAHSLRFVGRNYSTVLAKSVRPIDILDGLRKPLRIRSKLTPLDLNDFTHIMAYIARDKMVEWWMRCTGKLPRV